MVEPAPQAWAGPPITTARMVRLYETTQPLLVALRDVARPQAMRRGPQLVPPASLAGARNVIADAQRVLTHERGMRSLLDMGATVDWTSLLQTLELALVGFAAYCARYSYRDRMWGHTWRDENWLSFQLSGAKSRRATNALQEFGENLST